MENAPLDPTYRQIKEWISEHYDGMKVLYQGLRRAARRTGQRDRHAPAPGDGAVYPGSDRPGWAVSLELISTKEALPFYRKMGFEERPCERDGPGMLKMLR